MIYKRKSKRIYRRSNEIYRVAVGYTEVLIGCI